MLSAGLAAVAVTAALANFLLVVVAGACAGTDWLGATAVSSCYGRYMGVILQVCGHIYIYIFIYLNFECCVRMPDFLDKNGAWVSPSSKHSAS